MEKKSIISGLNLKKSFPRTGGKIEVLRGINLEVYEGEVVVILGASGVGKSTLLNILGTLDRPDGGVLKIMGNDANSLGEGDLNLLRNRSIGFIFQFHHLLPDFTALENVMMPSLIGDRPLGQARENAKRLLEAVRLSERLHHRPGELSGGEQQRVAVARAFANAPGLILADEPTGNLDDSTSETVNRLMLDLARNEGKTFVVVTHKKEFYNLADRAFLLDKGVLSDLEAENVDLV